MFWRIQAPVGLILLAFTAGVTLLYAVFLTWIETSAMLEGRRFTRELQAQRQLAETAEASRYTELRTHLQAELASLRTVAEARREGDRESGPCRRRSSAPRSSSRAIR